MRTIYHLVISCCLLCLFGVKAMGQSRWTLEACIAYALEHQPAIKAAELQGRLSELAVKQEKGSFWPSFSFSGNSGYRLGLSENPTTGVLESSNFLSTGFSVSAGIVLFNWFSKQHSLRARQLLQRADQMAVQKASNDVSLNVSAAYLQVLLAQMMKANSRLQMEQTKAQLAVTQQKVSLGVLSALDVAQIKVQVLSDSAALLTMEETEEKALLQLKAVMNLDADVPLQIAPVGLGEAGVGPGKDLDQLLPYHGEFDHLPQFKEADFQLQAANERLKAARASRMPSLSFYGSAGSNFVNIPSAQGFRFVAQQATGGKVNVNGTVYEVMAPSYTVSSFGVTPFFRQLHRNFGQNFGVSLQVPIFSGRSLVINEKRESILVEQARLQSKSLVQEMRTAVSIAYTEAVAAAKKIMLQERMVAQAEQALSAAQKRYGLNLLSTQDVLMQQTALQKARQDLLVVQYDFLFKKRLYFFYTRQ